MTIVTPWMTNVVAARDRLDDRAADPARLRSSRQDGTGQKAPSDSPMTVTTGSIALRRPWRTTTNRSRSPLAGPSGLCRTENLEGARAGIRAMIASGSCDGDGRQQEVPDGSQKVAH